MATSEKIKDFDQFYQTRLKPALSNKYALSQYGQSLRLVLNRFDHVIDYNVPHGKKMRGMCTYESVSQLIGSSAIEFLKKADHAKLLDQSKAIGWCIELVSWNKLDG